MSPWGNTACSTVKGEARRTFALGELTSHTEMSLRRCLYNPSRVFGQRSDARRAEVTMIRELFPTSVERQTEWLAFYKYARNQHSDHFASFVIFEANVFFLHSLCEYVYTNRDARQHRLSDEQHRIGARWSRAKFKRAPRLGDRGAGQRADLHNSGGCFGKPVSHHFCVQESETEECWWDVISLWFMSMRFRRSSSRAIHVSFRSRCWMGIQWMNTAWITVICLFFCSLDSSALTCYLRCT